MRWKVAACVALAATLVLAPSCSSGGGMTPPPATVPPPQPTPRENAIERQQRLDFEAAEKAFRTFQAEYRRVQRNGGSAKPTPLMTQTAEGPYLGEFTAAVKAFKSGGYYQRGVARIAFVSRLAYAEDTLRLEACEDGSAVKTFDSRDKYAGPGDVRRGTLEMRRIDTRWKIYSGDAEQVKSCDSPG